MRLPEISQIRVARESDAGGLGGRKYELGGIEGI